jgi:protein-export membrane protein SecD
MKRNNILLIIIIVIFAFSLWACIPLRGEKFGQDLYFGLDLVGGVHLVYEGDFSQNATGQDKQADISRAVLTIQKRIETYGVTEPIIQKMGSDRILVQLPGFTDIEAAKRLVEQTGFLEFREVEVDAQGQPVYLQNYLVQSQLSFIKKSEASDRIFVVSSYDKTGKYQHKTIAFLTNDNGTLKFVDGSGNPVDNVTLEDNSNAVSWIPARGNDGKQLTGDYLSDAQAIMDTSSVVPEPAVSIQWDSAGSVLFDQIAYQLYHSGQEGALQRNLGIFVDNSLLSAPQILKEKYEGSGMITGSFTVASAEELANMLKSGSLPIPLKKPPLYEEKVSATLGAKFIEKSAMAGVIGIILVMLFMIAYYRLPGFLASLALIFYAALVLTIFKLWPVPSLTLTLAGLGGFIASLGMAVDANILIFERMKEEFRTGRTLGAAIEAGFQRAWSAIFDSNLTTIIACIILVIVGSNITSGAPVKWFGVTLLIGVVISMFTAMVVTRTLLRLLVGSPLANKTWLYNVGGGKKS